MKKFETVQQTTIRIFLLFLMVSGIFVAINVPIAFSTSWGLTGWGYRKSAVVNGSTGAGASYQISLVVFFGSGTDNASHVYCDSACKSDFGDIRFTDDDGITELDYWMETLNDGLNATFWVEVADSLETSVTIYLYYGNPAVSTTSSFTNTMNTANPSITFDHHPSAYGFPPTQFNTEHNSANTLALDGSWGYMNSTDSWTQNMEGCYWIYSFAGFFDPPATRRFFVKWYQVGHGYNFPPYYTVFDTSIYVTDELASPQEWSSWTKIAGYERSDWMGNLDWTTSTFTNSTTGVFRYVKVEQKTTPGSLIIWGNTFVDAVWATKYVVVEPKPISWSEVEEEPEEPPPEPEPGPLTLFVTSNPEQGQEFTLSETHHNTPYSEGVSGTDDGVEQIVNGGFETGSTTGWDDSSQEGSVSTNNTHLGTYCYEAFGILYLTQWLLEPYKVVSGILSFSIWVRSTETDNVFVVFATSSGGYLYFLPDTTSSWKEYDLKTILLSVINSTSESFEYIRICNDANTETTAIDDLSLQFFVTDEFFVNAGFETEDFTGWDPNADPGCPFTINSEEQHAGAYCAQAYDDATYGDVEEQIINGGFESTENSTMEIWDDWGTTWFEYVDAGVIKEDNNDNVKHGTESMNITVNGVEIGIFHDYAHCDDPPIDISEYTYASLWIYGLGNSETMQIYFGSGEYNDNDDFYMYEFNDSIEGWNLYQFDFVLFNATGNPDWASINLIMLLGNTTVGTIIIDYLTVSGVTISDWWSFQWKIDNDTHGGSQNIVSQLGLTCDISQDFLLPIAVSTITSFGFWAKGNPLGEEMRITYETRPGEEDLVEVFYAFSSSDYEYVNLQESIPNDVIAIFQIEIHYQDDDYLVQIDDVSLVGSTYDSSGFMGDINQYFSTPIRSDTIMSFGWQMRSTFQNLDIPALYVELGILGEEPITFNFFVCDAFEYLNMLNYITGNSTAYVTYIWLSYGGDWGAQLYIDDFTLQVLLADEVTIELSTTESQHRNCTQYYFQEWQINGTFYSTNLTIIFSMSSNTTATMVFTYFSDEYAFGSGWIQLNSDSDFSDDSITDDAYYNPHLYGSIDTWSIDFTDYMTLMVDSVSVNSGHIAAGTWYYNWTAISETQPDRLLLNNTFILDTDVRIRALNYTNGAWLRVAFAAAFCDRYGTSGYDVKYTELDIYDNPLGALNSSSGDAAGNGNVIYQGQDVVEFRVANVLVSDTWSHFTWNLTQYINAAWGDMVANNEFKLESVYCVVEVIGETSVTVDVDNFKLYVVNDTSWQTPYSYWDGVASEVLTDVEEAKWTTTFRNSTGYSVYSTIRNTDWIVGTPYEIFGDNDDLSTIFVGASNGTATMTLTDVTDPKVEGANVLEIHASITDLNDYTNLNYSWLFWQDWTGYDFLCFYMRFNTTDLFHRVVLYDSDGKKYQWQVKDISETRYHDTSYNSGYNKVVIPLMRPEFSEAGFNWSAIDSICIQPCYSYENGTLTSGWDATLYIDSIYLDVGKNITLFYNVPLGANNYTLLTKRDITGYMGQYVPTITSITGIVDADNFWVLRPRFDTAFGTWGLYNTTADANNGLSMFGAGSEGTYVSVVYGESRASVIIPSGYAPCRKIAVTIRLPPEDGLATVNGTIEQEYVWGGISETKVCLYVENPFPVFGDAYIDYFDCLDWVIAEKRNYMVYANLTMPDVNLDQVAFNFTDASNHNMGFIFHNSTATVTVFGSTGQNETYMEFLTSTSTLLSYQWHHSLLELKVPFWVKRYAVDTFDVDFGMFINSTTGAETGWFILHDSYFNLYSRGGLEKLITSGDAGKYEGGEYFSIFAGNDSYAYSEQYWVNLVHTKMLITIDFSQVPQGTFYSTFEIAFGLQYYDGESWTQFPNFGPSVQIYVNSAIDDVTDKQVAMTLLYPINHNIGSILQPLKCYYVYADNEAQLWVDLWFNKANDSSIVGIRVGSYFFPMYNGPDFWKPITGGTWGVSWKNETSSSTFMQLLKNADMQSISSHEIEMVKLWAKVSVQGVSGEDLHIGIKNIRSWDLTFNSEMTGIQTPSFEEPRTPMVPIGGIYGILASFLTGLMNALAPAFSFIWSSLVWIFDMALQALTGQPNLFSGFLSFIGTSVSIIASWIIMLAQYASSMILVITNTIVWFFTNIFAMVWGIFNFVILNPVMNIFTVIAAIFGMSVAWLVGGTYTDGFGTVWDFSFLHGLQFAGLSGGLAIIAIVFVCGFFFQLSLCLVTMSIDPIMQPVQLFWGFVMFMIQIFDVVFNAIQAFARFVVQIVQAIRDMAPRII